MLPVRGPDEVVVPAEDVVVASLVAEPPEVCAAGCTNHCPARPWSCQKEWVQVLPFHWIVVTAPFCVTCAVWPHAWKLVGLTHWPVVCVPCSLVSSSWPPAWEMVATCMADDGVVPEEDA